MWTHSKDGTIWLSRCTDNRKNKNKDRKLLTNPMAYGTRRFNAAFTRALDRKLLPKKIKRVSGWKAQINRKYTLKLNWYISTLTEVFLNPKIINCMWTHSKDGTIWQSRCTDNRKIGIKTGICYRKNEERLQMKGTNKQKIYTET